MWDQLDAINSDLLVINSISTCFGHLYVHHQEIRLRSTAYSCLSCCSCCDAGESIGKMCALCGECCLPGRATFSHREGPSSIPVHTTTAVGIQCVPLATEPDISLITLTPIKILQRNLNRSTFVVWEMKRNVSVVRLIVVTRSSGPPASQFGS